MLVRLFYYFIYGLILKKSTHFLL